VSRTLTPDDLLYANCADCNREILGDSPLNLAIAARFFTPAEMPPRVAGRVLGRPYCGPCLTPPVRDREDS
jgi:hypothetical protein